MKEVLSDSKKMLLASALIRDKHRLTNNDVWVLNDANLTSISSSITKISPPKFMKGLPTKKLSTYQINFITHFN